MQCMQECARYLETLKSYETKPADLIQGRSEEDYLSKLNAAFTTVRGINKTDVLTLAGAFKTAAGVMRADMQELSALPGIGPTKVSAQILWRPTLLDMNEMMKAPLVMHHKPEKNECLQVKRLHETFHEPFRKAMRQGPLSFSPTQAAARNLGQQAEQAPQAGADAAAVAAMPAIGMPMESALEDADEDHIDMDLPFL